MTLAGKHVFVTGATGFLGGHLCQRLAAEGALIKALARRSGRDRYIRGLPLLEIVPGDITDADRMRELVSGAHVVFHVAAATGGDMAHQQRANVDGTRHVMEAAVAANVSRVVHVSTISVYGYRKLQDVTEDTAPDPGADPYHSTKLEAEKLVRTICMSAKVPYAIVRPGMIYGPRSNTWTKTMFRVAKRRPTIWVGDGRGSSYPIFVDDVVDLLVMVATHSAAANETFNATPDPSPTWREFLQTYAALVGHNSWFGIPPSIIKPIAWVLAKLVSEHNRLKDLPDLVSFINGYKTYRMEKARTLLNWSPKVELHEGVQRCIPYLREKGLMD